jgi:hypothetical protein
MTLLPSSDRAFQSQVATRDGTQNTLVWIDARLYGLHLTATHSGGYRAMPATGDRHAARLVFQSASVLIADLVRPGTAPPRMADQMHVSRFCMRRCTIVIAAWSRE